MFHKRKAMLFILFIMLPITVNYFSPIVVLLGNFRGFITASFIIWSFMLISSLFLGRSFCAYICPYGGLQMVCDEVLHKKLVKLKGLRQLRYVLGILWFGLIIYSIARHMPYLQLHFFYNTESYVSTDSIHALMRYYMILGGLMIFSFIFGKRGGCHYVCPMSILNIIGSKLLHFFRLPALKVKSNDNPCIHCKKCNAACPMSLDVEKMVKEKNMQHTECITCGECAKACPKKCIDYKFQV